jgi:hypothetical protein
MPLPFLSRLRLPSSVAVLLGLGALSAAGARADASHQLPGSGTEPRDLVTWSEGGRLFLSEDGNPGAELRLGDTAEARRLRQLLQQQGGAATGVRFGRMILAGGGGMGISWERPRNPKPPVRTEDAARAGNSHRALNPHHTGTPRHAGMPNTTNAGNETKR